jgi:hypothetical protein
MAVVQSVSNSTAIQSTGLNWVACESILVLGNNKYRGLYPKVGLLFCTFFFKPQTYENRFYWKECVLSNSVFCKLVAVWLFRADKSVKLLYFFYLSLLLSLSSSSLLSKGFISRYLRRLKDDSISLFEQWKCYSSFLTSGYQGLFPKETETDLTVTWIWWCDCMEPGFHTSYINT